MKERPILFSTPMVKAILKGEKTQTRRVVKPQGAILTDEIARSLNIQPPSTENMPVIPCPYGQIGDVLWVRETWIDLQKTPVMGAGSEKYYGLKYWYRADNTKEMEIAGNYKPSIFMPKEACRIRLKITDIRVERLSDIDESDALNEGIGSFTKDGVGFKFGLDGWNWSCQNGHPFMCSNAALAYSELWESINGKGSWDKNPFVWVVTFERI